MDPARLYEDVDVAIVMESTYPYLKGGVSAVVHDILVGNPDLTFGIIHITWDSGSPHEDLYGMPDNARWVKPVYLSMQEHQVDFAALSPRDLCMRRPARRRLAHRLFDALDAIVAGDPEPMWELYDEGMNPRTRRYPLWALLGCAEFMEVLVERLPGLDLSLVDVFWLMREFWSLACAVLGGDMPAARVYHAHTTGYASLLGAAAARQNDGAFLLTEHNLYVRDTVNTLLERDMALPVTAADWRTFDVSTTQRAWMAWWIEMGRFCYPSAEVITYLYPKAIMEAADLGSPVQKSVVIPNGMVPASVEAAHRSRLRAVDDLLAGGGDRVWRFAYIARVVPIKGLLDLIDSLDRLVQRGVTNFHLDVLGPTEHVPDYYEQCVAKIARLGLAPHITFHGTVDVKARLGDVDLLVLSSYNEGQPIVVLEAMTAGIPTVGTEVGGMAQLVRDTLTTPEGRSWGSCGVLVDPLNMVEGLADGLAAVMSDPELYATYARNARGRVENFFQLDDAMRAYNDLYRELGRLPSEQSAAQGAEVVPSPPAAALPTPRRRGQGAHRRTAGAHRMRPEMTQVLRTRVQPR
ncbi:GT4 family glycosyltransferase PelF [Modestobacter sp. NPDC049651]|uniref:GT4 family glycosyltransferase PelF n=1 Tax=unclassified Modestobacter TaxID=2643866 RepID=UPI0033EA2088